MWYNIVEELTILAVLHYEEELTLSLNDLVQLDDVGMPDLLEDLDLTTDSLNVFLVFNSWFLKNLDRNLYIKVWLSVIMFVTYIKDLETVFKQKSNCFS